MQDQPSFCRQAGPEHDFNALTGLTIHGSSLESDVGEMTGHTVCDEASKEVFGVGQWKMQHMKEQVSQLASHQQTDQMD